MGIFDRLFGKHKTSKKRYTKYRLTEKGKNQIMIREDQGIVTIIIRKKLVDRWMNSKEAHELGLPKKGMVAMLAALLAGYTEEEGVLLFGQGYSEGKVMVKYLRSGFKLVTDPSWNEPCYLVMRQA
ncbi:MAG: hypothetical protein WAV28_02100 [Sedimentisphaerales bacterium]|jgi:hypothetical protein